MLVARQHELAVLGERLAEKRPVVLVGEAGIGKTTLLRAAVAAAGLRVYEGGGLASLSWRSYLPVTRAVGAEPPEGDPAFVAEWLESKVGEGVLVLDDLHWADAATARLLPLLVGRIFLLGAVRLEDDGAAAVLDICEEEGIELVRVQPLSRADADELARRRQPSLSQNARARVVQAAAGNPLLLEELADGDGRSIELGLAARIERLPREARQALATLGLLGRPCAAQLLDGGVEPLRSLGLVEGDGVVVPRHALLAEAAVASLVPAERTAIHARLARLLEDPGESARHHLAAGESADARRKALAAAKNSARGPDRAQHLATAALASRGERHDELRLEAARELVAVGELERAVAVLGQLEGDHAETRAEEHLIRARSGLARGETTTFRSELARGLWLVRGSGSPVEVRLQLERAHDAASMVSPERAVHVARRAWRLAHTTGIETARADAYLGEALSVVGSRDCIMYLESAIAGARRAGDTELELDTAFDLIGALDYVGATEQARRHTDELNARATALHARRWTVQSGWARVRFLLYLDGDLDEAIDELSQLQDDRSLGIELDQVRADLGLALADRGRDAEAVSLLERSLATSSSQFGRDVLRLSALEADWLAGRFDAVFAGATQPLQEGLELLAELARAKAAFELDQARRDVDDLPHGPFAAAVDAELTGLAASSNGRTDASALLATAAELWAGQLIRCELACLWEAGEAARRAGDDERARALLLDVGGRCERLGFLPLLRRIRRSLRLLGHRPSGQAARRPTLLTEREREVMSLVAEGLSSRSIAERLFIAPATVDTHVRAAREKLGARTRAEAAARAGAYSHAATDRR